MFMWTRFASSVIFAILLTFANYEYLKKGISKGDIFIHNQYINIDAGYIKNSNELKKIDISLDMLTNIKEQILEKGIKEKKCTEESILNLVKINELNLLVKIIMKSSDYKINSICSEYIKNELIASLGKMGFGNGVQILQKNSDYREGKKLSVFTAPILFILYSSIIYILCGLLIKNDQKYR